MSVPMSAPKMPAGAPGRSPRPTPTLTPPGTKYQLRVCTNKTCKRQGSEQVVKLINDLVLPTVEAQSCGCLGNCGNGPNAILLPHEVMLSHVSTPTDVAEVLSAYCEVTVQGPLLQATQLRLAGNTLATDGDLEAAVQKYTEGLALNAPGSLHLLYSNRSAAYLQLQRKAEALADAQAAVAAAPLGFHRAWVRLIDAHYALGQYAEAAAACLKAVQVDRGFTTTSEFKSIVRALQKSGQQLKM